MAWGAGLVIGCTSPEAPTGVEPRVAIDVAALNLPGVGDVVWDLQVVNGRTPTPDVVWERRITSSAYGDSAGSASYVGPCDADPAVSANVVRVWVVGVYAGDIPLADAGVFNSGSTAGVGAVVGAPIAFQNPTSPAAPLAQTVPCARDADVGVAFDVALMRPAEQGFFDVAVSFNDLFCAAKVDCCDDADGDGCEAGEDLRLLFDADGQRVPTVVVGFACTAGVRDDVVTELYMTDLELDCTAPNSGVDFAAQLTLDPSRGPGNLCTAGALAGCSAITLGAGLADTYLYQIASFRGEEALASGGVDAQKVYWNIALGAKAGLSACRLRLRATADDAADAGDNVAGGVIAAGAVYPYVQWDAALGACPTHAGLAFDAAGAPVTAAYTGIADDDLHFAHQFGVAPPVMLVLPAGPSLDFGRVSVTQSTTFTWTITNDGGASATPLTVTAHVTGARFALTANDCDAIAPGDSCAVTVSFAPDVAGVETGGLTLTPNAGNAAVITLSGEGGLCVPGTVVFDYTGAEVAWTVPDFCAELTIKVWGAGGGPGGSRSGNMTNYAGGGGFVGGTLSVSPGEELAILVGEGGGGGSGAAPPPVGPFGGGGPAASGTGEGGGRSQVARACTAGPDCVAGTEYLFVAGGGGGGGGCLGPSSDAQTGGRGGGLVGGDGSAAACANGAGKGGTQSAGGAAGTNPFGDWYQGYYPAVPPTAGSFASGGAGASDDTYGDGSRGSAGGGGWYGGGGATSGIANGGNSVVGGGGGGGSSYVTPLAGSPQNVQAGAQGAPGNATDPDRGGGRIGYGGFESPTGATGGAGRVVISYP